MPAIVSYSLPPPSSLLLLMAQGLPSPLSSWAQSRGLEVRKLAWELQSLNGPRGLIHKGHCADLRASARQAPFPLQLLPQSKPPPPALSPSSMCPGCGQHSLSSAWGRLHPAGTPKRQLSPSRPDHLALASSPPCFSPPHTT